MVRASLVLTGVLNSTGDAGFLLSYAPVNENTFAASGERGAAAPFFGLGPFSAVAPELDSKRSKSGCITHAY